MNDRNIDDLHPLLEQTCREHMRQCESEGIKAFVVFTWRGTDEQDRIYAQGRTIPGNIVTNARGSQSKHCFTIAGQPASKAYDIAIKDDSGAIIKDGSHPSYHRAGAIGKELGLGWGGDWHSLYDPGHFEIP